MIRGKNVVHAFFGLSVALQIGCSTDAEIPVSSDTNESASPAAALPNQTFQSNSNPEYTGEVLADGTVVLNWPMDPEATGYSIYRDNTKVAQVSSDDLSFTDTTQLLNDAAQSILPKILNRQDAEYPTKYFQLRQTTRSASG